MFISRLTMPSPNGPFLRTTSTWYTSVTSVEPSKIGRLSIPRPIGNYPALTFKSMIPTTSSYAYIPPPPRFYRHCKPGGWIDIAEFEMDIFCDDGTLSPDCELKQFYTLVSQATAITGREFNNAANFLPIIEKVGFVNAHHTMVKMPLGPWAVDKKQKEIGAYILLSTETGFEAFGIKLFTQVLGMGVDEAGALITAAQKQATNKRVHVYGKQ